MRQTTQGVQGQLRTLGVAALCDVRTYRQQHRLVKLSGGRRGSARRSAGAMPQQRC